MKNKRLNISVSYYIFFKSNKSFGSISKAVAILTRVLTVVFTSALSILPICTLGMSQSLASCCCERSFFSLNCLICIPKLVKNVSSEKFIFKGHHNSILYWIHICIQFLLYLKNFMHYEKT